MVAEETALLRRVSLRFVDSRAEDAYTRQRVVQLKRSLWWFALFLFVAAAICCCVQVLARKTAWNATELELIDATTIVYGVAGAFSAVVLAATRSKFLERRLKPVRWELISVVYFAIIMGLAIPTATWYVARLRGFDPEVVLIPPGECRRFSDTGVILSLVGITAAGHVLVQVRWCVMWFVEVFAVTLYSSAVVGLGSPERNGTVPFRIFVFAFIQVCFCFGKRQLEHSERNLFASLAQERTKRYMSEAKLQELEQRLPARSQAQSAHNDEITTLASAVSTTVTDPVFEGVRYGRNVEQSLAELFKVGSEEQWLLSPDDIRLDPDAIIGTGNYGVVVAGKLFSQEVAVKVNKEGITAKQLLTMSAELRVLRQVQHPNIVLFHGACIDADGSELALVLEMVNGCCLFELMLGMKVATGVPVPREPERGLLLLDICRALRYLHERRPKIVHGDLKASNVMVEFLREPRAKLIDFGLARVVTRSARPLGGTLHWMAPELVSKDRASSLRPSTSADVFSFGRLVYFVATGTVPLKGWSSSKIQQALAAQYVPQLVWPYGSPWTWGAQAVAEPCMARDPSSRPSMQEVQCQMRAWLRQSARPTVAASSTAVENEGLPFSAALRRIRTLLKAPLQPQVSSRGTTLSQPTGTADGNLAWPHLMPTPPETRSSTLCAALEAWNVTLPTSACCSFHGRLAVAREHITQLQARPCKEIPLRAWTRQCPICFVITRDDLLEGGCSVCGVSMPLTEDASGNEAWKPECPAPTPLLDIVPAVSPATDSTATPDGLHPLAPA